MKGRVVTDGKPQRKKYDKSQSSSPTCHQDTIMMCLLIDAMEKRCIGNEDVPGAYKTVNGKQCTSGWYVDDLKTSHEDKNVVYNISTSIASSFGKLNSKIDKNKHT